jgi:hypothetical protein
MAHTDIEMTFVAPKHSGPTSYPAAIGQPAALLTLA